MKVAVHPSSRPSPHSLYVFGVPEELGTTGARRSRRFNVRTAPGSECSNALASPTVKRRKRRAPPLNTYHFFVVGRGRQILGVIGARTTPSPPQSGGEGG